MTKKAKSNTANGEKKPERSRSSSPFIVRRQFPYVLETYIKGLKQARFPAWIYIDRELNLLEAGGALDRFHIPDLKYRCHMPSELDFLEGAEHIQAKTIQFSVQAFSGIFADLHYLPVDDGRILDAPGPWPAMYVLLLDVTQDSLHQNFTKRARMRSLLEQRDKREDAD